MVDRIARRISPQGGNHRPGTAPGGIGAARVQTSSDPGQPSTKLLAQLDHAAEVAVDRVITVISLTALSTGCLEAGQPCRIDLTLRPTSHTPKIARAAQPNRCALGQGGAVNSAATSGTPRKRARPSPASSNTPRLFQVKIGRARGASRFIQGLVVRTSQW